MKTKEEILQDVQNLIFKQGGRSLGLISTCAYLGIGGKVCGHSMAVREDMRELCLGGRAIDLIDEFGDALHKEEYQGHEPRFWQEVQGFHDNYHNWSVENLITDSGLLNKKEILRKFK